MCVFFLVCNLQFAFWIDRIWLLNEAPLFDAPSSVLNVFIVKRNCEQRNDAFAHAHTCPLFLMCHKFTLDDSVDAAAVVVVVAFDVCSHRNKEECI